MYEFVGQFMGLNILSVVGRKGSDVATYTTSDCFLVEIDGAVGIEDCFAGTGERGVL